MCSFVPPGFYLAFDVIFRRPPDDYFDFKRTFKDHIGDFLHIKSRIMIIEMLSKGCPKLKILGHGPHSTKPKICPGTTGWDMSWDIFVPNDVPKPLAETL